MDDVVPNIYHPGYSICCYPNVFDPDSLKVSKYTITVLVLAWIKLAVDAKRWHDRDKSALWILY